MTAGSPDLDLHFPAFEEPGPPPPVLTARQYGEWIESLWEGMKKDGTLEAVIARRPRPSEEMFIIP